MIVPKLNTQHMTDPWRDHSSGVLAKVQRFRQAQYWWNTGVYVDVRIFVKQAY